MMKEVIDPLLVEKPAEKKIKKPRKGKESDA